MNVTLLLLFCCFVQIFAQECSCGVGNARKRIIGGTEVSRGKYPWVVYLHQTKPDHDSFCGGAIINDRYILTAAHCTNTATSVRFSYGSIEKGSFYTMHEVEKIIQHEAFHYSSLHNDISLLKLKKPLKFSANVQPICLPTADMDQSGNLTVAGWGKTEDGSHPHTLLETTFTESDWDTCKSKHHKKIIDSQICASAVGHSLCGGDSGSALVKRENGKYHVVGIASFVHLPCGSDKYDVYTKVSSFLDWIAANTDDADQCY